MQFDGGQNLVHTIAANREAFNANVKDEPEHERDRNFKSEI